MPERTVEIDRVSKRYVLGERHTTLRDALAASGRRLIRPRPDSEPRQTIWSLRDVSLEMREGEAVGVIGRNGAGKTTLLKIVTRITEPTSGLSRTRGRVGSMLEVGTGFHPELTGRENVYLNGAILGIRKAEITRRFDEIVEFAGVGRFIDTPVKRYSSGMYLRLAFAVAAHLDVEIMAVDEVLAVGDWEFQQRCLTKMGSLEREGRTILFSSHDLQAVVRLCRTALWLEEGRVQAHGPAREVVDAYLSSGTTPVGERSFADDSRGPVALRSVRITDAAGVPRQPLHRDEPFAIEVRFFVRERVPDLDLTVFVDNLGGVRLLDEAWSERGPLDRGAIGEYAARVIVPPVLVVGDYLVGVWLGSRDEEFAYEEAALRFRLAGPTHGRTNRVAQLGLTWDVQRLDP
jgi:ABC-type polysaccharide/polyol phosphate transport system ATPase subunit